MAVRKRLPSRRDCTSCSRWNMLAIRSLLPSVDFVVASYPCFGCRLAQTGPAGADTWSLAGIGAR